MRSRRIATALVLAACVILAGPPAHAQDQPQPPEASGPAIPVGTGTVSDADIADRIDGILDAVTAFDGVTRDVSSGVVTLSGTVPETTDIDRLDGIVGRIEGVVAVENAVEASSDVTERLTPAIGRIGERLRQTIAFLPLLAIGFGTLLAISALGWLLTRSDRLFTRVAPNAFIAEILRTVVRFFFVFAGIVVALDLMGATALLGTLLGAAGIIGLAVGFGVRDTIENFVASVMLSVRQPFSPNDLVEIEGETGNVIRLTSRATILLSPDGNHVRLPNAAVFKSKIINYTREPQRRFLFELGVDSDADLAGARDTGLAAIRALSFVLDTPAPAAWIERVGDSNVVLQFSGWIDQRQTDYAQARGESIRIAKKALEAQGFGLPEPIYRVRLDQAAAAHAPNPAEPTRRPAPAPPPDPASAAAPKDETIERKVDADRRAGSATDLLNPDALTGD